MPNSIEKASQSNPKANQKADDSEPLQVLIYVRVNATLKQYAITNGICSKATHIHTSRVTRRAHRPLLPSHDGTHISIHVSMFYYHCSAVPEWRHVQESLFFLYQERFSCRCPINGLVDPAAVKLGGALYASHTRKSHRYSQVRNGYLRTTCSAYSFLSFNIRQNDATEITEYALLRTVNQL